MRGAALRSALARPVRKGPQLLYLPDRDRIMARARQGMADAAQSFPVISELIACELSVVETIAHGKCKSLSSFFWKVDGLPLDLQFVLPMSAGVDDYLMAAYTHGKQAQLKSESIAMAKIMKEEL